MENQECDDEDIVAMRSEDPCWSKRHLSYSDDENEKLEKLWEMLFHVNCFMYLFHDTCLDEVLGSVDVQDIFEGEDWSDHHGHGDWGNYHDEEYGEENYDDEDFGHDHDYQDEEGGDAQHDDGNGEMEPQGYDDDNEEQT